MATVAVALVAAATIPAGGFGPLGRLSIPLQSVVALVALDLLWYACHRAVHTVGALWPVHSVHHSPSQLCVLVHQVFHERGHDSSVVPPWDLVFRTFVFDPTLGLSRAPAPRGERIRG